MKKQKNVMAFGTFDGFHKGHRSFLKQAKQCGDYLIVVVAQDEAVHQFKNHSPRLGLLERMDAVKQAGIADAVVAGDTTQDNWEVIRKHRPAVIALGHDQEVLRQALEAKINDFPFSPELRTMDAHKPHRYHSSLLVSKDGQHS